MHHLGHRGDRRRSRPQGAFTLDDVAGVGVVPKPAEGTKCARSWRITKDVGSDPDFPELSARDAAAVREFDRGRRHEHAADGQIDRPPPLHYTVVHEQDEQIRSLQLAPQHRR